MRIIIFFFLVGYKFGDLIFFWKIKLEIKKIIIKKCGRDKNDGGKGLTFMWN